MSAYYFKKKSGRNVGTRSGREFRRRSDHELTNQEMVRILNIIVCRKAASVRFSVEYTVKRLTKQKINVMMKKSQTIDFWILYSIFTEAKKGGKVWSRNVLQQWISEHPAEG